MTILEILAQSARERVEAAKKSLSPEQIKQQAFALEKGSFEFETALGKGGISFICECKKASPSKGIISPDFPYLDIAKQYQSAGAALCVGGKAETFADGVKLAAELIDSGKAYETL
ncbi:MAG: hypothetical protein II722_04985, partial [Ruminococcus sp.]|nr:hypothetical protein [Ruminococcus sp.]